MLRKEGLGLGDRCSLVVSVTHGLQEAVESTHCTQKVTPRARALLLRGHWEGPGGTSEVVRA